MKVIKVEYQLKSEKVEETLPIIRQFIKNAQQDERVAHYSGYRYMSDQTRFVHLMKFGTPEDEKAHSESDYTEKFVKTLYPNCTSQPVFEEVSEI